MAVAFDVALVEVNVGRDWLGLVHFGATEQSGRQEGGHKKRATQATVEFHEADTRQRR